MRARARAIKAVATTSRKKGRGEEAQGRAVSQGVDEQAWEVNTRQTGADISYDLQLTLVDLDTFGAWAKYLDPLPGRDYWDDQSRKSASEATLPRQDTRMAPAPCMTFDEKKPGPLACIA